ncbi:DUF4054 domain-containing protein [Solilutibacter silvestris]|uniref:DUF4054 domain-containing protein n=1 Tax=Solilutibacter silvestris TaxID=1645665 RepID=UPI003D348224
MSITVAQFRTDFPAFSDTTKWPDPMVQFWITQAGLSLNEDRWGALLPLGTELFVAHNLVVSAGDATATTPGAIKGPASSKSVDKVSVSYDIASITIADGDFWNMSRFGIQFLRYARMMGAGGIQL